MFFRALKLLLLLLFAGLLSASADPARPPQYLNTNYWKLRIGYYFDSSPALDTNGVLYISGWDGNLTAINKDQTVRWQLRMSTDMKSSPAIGVDGTVYVGCRDWKLHAVTRDGKRKWEFKTGGWVDSSAGIASDGTIYFGSWDKKFYALNSDGSKRWEFETGAEVESSPAIGEDGTIYFGSHDKKFYALNRDGSKKWDFATDGQIISSPAIASDGTLITTSVDGYMYALNADGTLRWKTHTGGITASSPVLGTNGNIYVGVNSNFCAFTSEGKKLWEFRIGQYFPTDYVYSSAAVGADNCTYFGTDDHRFWKVEPDGFCPWGVWLASPCKSSPVIGENGTIYVLSYSQFLFGITNVTTLADSSWPMFRADPQHTGRARSRKD